MRGAEGDLFKEFFGFTDDEGPRDSVASSSQHAPDEVDPQVTQTAHPLEEREPDGVDPQGSELADAEMDAETPSTGGHGLARIVPTAQQGPDGVDPQVPPAVGIEMEIEAARAEGRRYTKQYFEDAQFIFSRVQHHFHKKTKKGYVPLPRACTSSRCKDKCKAGFPKEKQMTLKARLICPGNFRTFGLRIRGKRNALGLTLNRRTCQWQSGTCPSFAVIFRSNSHTAPNYRLPPNPEYHDDELCSRDCGHGTVKLLRTMAKVAQRAQAEATHYYCGYTYKGQKAGKYELKAIARVLNFVREGMKDRTPGRQWHRITSRTLQDLHHRSTIRVATEEVNLSANLNPHDVTAAEFIRTFQSESFPGGNLVSREKAEREKGDEPLRRLRHIPASAAGDAEKKAIELKSFEDLYGYRGQDTRVYYLNPWEFTMYWEPSALQKPATRVPNADDLTEWIEQPETGEVVVAGVHYRVKEDLAEHPDFVVFPDSANLQMFRHLWILRRRFRPHIPQPDGTPMPDREENREERSRLFSVYMRPWVLDRSTASASVPHLADLDLVRPTTRRRLVGRAPARFTRSYQEAWSSYVRGQIVSRHAEQTIKQFMAVCCTKSHRTEGNTLLRSRQPDEEERKTPNDLSLEQIHEIIGGMSAKAKAAADAGGGESSEDNDDEKTKASDTMLKSINLGTKVWAFDKKDWPAGDCDRSGLLSKEDLQLNSRKADANCKPGGGSRYIGKKAYVKMTSGSAAAWLAKVCQEDPAPQGAQLQYLRGVIERCKQEAAEMHGRVPKQDRNTEPSRECLIGPPGCGKSECLKWTIRFF